jgi:hypothetical protein
MRRLLIVLVLLASLPPTALAGDAGTIAAALKDEASECRYFLHLCAEAERNGMEANATTARLREATAKMKANGNRHNVEAANQLSAQAEAYVAEIYRLAKERYEAGQVIRAKHEKMPECFRQCQGLDLSQFGGN